MGVEALEWLDSFDLPAMYVPGDDLAGSVLNEAAFRLLGAGWTERVHPGDHARLAHDLREGGAHTAFRVTHDQLSFGSIHVEIRRRQGMTLGVLVAFPSVPTGDPQLEALFEALPFEVWERDVDGVLVRQNREALANRRVHLGSTVRSMGVSPEIADLWTELNARAMRGEVISRPIDYQLDGRLVSQMNIIAPVRVAGRVRGTVCVNVDVTPVKIAEAELRALQSNVIKGERLAALGELAAVVAHEVRNPLAAIYASLSTLKRHVETHDAELLLRVLEEEASRLNQTVNDLLSYVRPLEPQRRRDDLVPLVEGVLRQRFDSQAEGAGAVRHRVVVPAAVEPIEIDPVLVRIAVANLVANALQAMPDGGELVVTIHQTPIHTLVSVEDTGAGIPPEILGRVFEPFFTTRATGSGLGLAIVRRILEAHDGAVLVESNARGTVFTLQFPR